MSHMPDASSVLAAWRSSIDVTLDDFLDRQSVTAAALTPRSLDLLSVLRPRLQGGKRLRPAFALAGWLATGREVSAEILAAAAALELVQISALIHDDLIDGSDTRRGLPAAHVALAAEGNRDSAFGQGAAILLGDLCLVWAAEQLNHSGLDAAALSAARLEFEAMLTEVTIGQYLDLAHSTATGTTIEDSFRVMELKTAKYTVERPLRMGAAAAGAPMAKLKLLSDFALPLGVAFQLRDDLLGVFGDPTQTGKPAGDDLREGKATVLVGLALAAASVGEAQAIRTALGNQQLTDLELAAARAALHSCGAVDEVERRISALHAQAVSVLPSLELSATAEAVLLELALAATARSL